MKITTTTSSLLAIVGSMLCSTTTNAFTTSMLPSSSRHTSLHYSIHDEDKPIQCYLIQTDDVDIPQIVCTSNPEEYAWFHGLDSEQLLPTDGAIHDEAVQCVEDESPRGVPEWECESAFQ